jgi:hypothetical protein
MAGERKGAGEQLRDRSAQSVAEEIVLGGSRRKAIAWLP